MKERIIGPDILRALAVVCVIGGHFFALNTPFNATPFVGASMLIQGGMKSFMQGFGVPMFLMLSGYFCCNKDISVKYFKGITRILYSYAFISVITWLILDDAHSPLQLIKSVLGYHTIGYAWYIEMYIGLFLLIPFINTALNKIFENRLHTNALIIVLIVLCSLPTTVDRGEYKLIPSYWLANFPILCYCIGAYIRRYQPTIRKKKVCAFACLLLPFLSPCIILGYNILTDGSKAYLSLFGAYYSIVGLCTDVLLFLLMYRINGLPKFLETIISSIAKCSLEIFLFSYMFDKLIYAYFIKHYFVSQQTFIVWFVPIVVIVLSLSWIAAQIKIVLFSYTSKFFK